MLDFLLYYPIWLKYNSLALRCREGAKAPIFIYRWWNTIFVRVYIDGYNLFYGRLKHRDAGINAHRKKLRWLDPKKLVEQFLHGNYKLDQINFYTSDITALYTGDKSPSRQREYYKALMTVENINIIKGRFSKNSTLMPVYPIKYIINPDGTKQIEKIMVLKTEEKRSDVNIAAHLVRDACQNKFDMAILVSNDSDLLEPLKIIHELGKKFLILSPNEKYCFDFVSNLDSRCMRKIQEKHIKIAQFPDEIWDVTNTFIAKRPIEWS